MAILSTGILIMTRSLHHKITCQKQILTSVLAGEFQESSQDIAMVWAEVIVKSSDIKNAARQRYLSPLYLVRIRYDDRLLATRNILWQGKNYRVLSMLNPDNRKQILEFHMVEDHP